MTAKTANRPKPLVLVRRDGRAGILTLNRPDTINALNRDMILALTRALREWAEDDDVATVVIRGAGDRGLCAGGDIVSIRDDALAGDGRASEAFWRDEYTLNALIANYPKPYLALMDGYVLGGGVGISAHGSHRIVTERTKLGMPETRIGFIPDVGGTWLLGRAPNQLGTYLALTGAHVDGADAIAAGLADHYVLARDLDRLVELVAEHPVTNAVAKVAVVPPPSRLESWTWITDAFSFEDVTEIIDALRALQVPEARETAETLGANSPTALVITLRALRETGHMARLEEALEQELRIGLHLLRSHDFAEGIRAQVVDKDRSPRWIPSALRYVDRSLTETLAFGPSPQ